MIIDASELVDSPILGEPPPAAGPQTPSPEAPAGRRSRTSGVRERRDKTPKTSPRPRVRASSADKLDAETAQIGAALGQLLAMPGAIFGMLGEPFLGDSAQPDGQGGYTPIPGHFSRTGPPFGIQLAKASETNPQLRRILKAAMTGDSFALLILGAVTYIGVPVVYLMTPNHSPIRRTLGVPDRPGRVPPAGPEPAGYPFADSEPVQGADDVGEQAA